MTSPSFNFRFRTEKYYLEILYDGGISIDARDVQNARELQASLNEDTVLYMRSLMKGLGLLAIGSVGWILCEKFGITANPLAPGSTIFEVVIPSYAGEDFQKLVSSGGLEEMVHNEFQNMEERIGQIFGDDFEKVKEINKDVLLQLKNVSIKQVNLCDARVAKKAFKQMCEALKDEERKGDKLSRPRNLSIQEGPTSPSTSVFVSYDDVKEATGYIITAHDLESDKIIEKITAVDYCVVKGLEPGHSYVFSVESVLNGIKSDKTTEKSVVRTAAYDPYPWREKEEIESIADSAMGESIATSAGKMSTEYRVDGDEMALEDLPELWQSDLHVELRKIFRRRFDDSKMKRVLCKCDELGIIEAKDLKYVDVEEVAKEFKESLKMVEVLKLSEYARDQYPSPPRIDNSTAGKGGNHFSIHDASLRDCTIQYNR